MVPPASEMTLGRCVVGSVTVCVRSAVAPLTVKLSVVGRSVTVVTAGGPRANVEVIFPPEKVRVTGPGKKLPASR